MSETEKNKKPFKEDKNLGFTNTTNYISNNKDFNPYNQSKKSLANKLSKNFKDPNQEKYKDISHKIKISNNKRNMSFFYNRYYVIFKLLIKSWFKNFFGPFTAFALPAIIIIFSGFFNLDKQTSISILFYAVAIAVLSINLSNLPTIYVEYRNSSLIKRIATTPLSRKEFLFSIIIFNFIITILSIIFSHAFAYIFFHQHYDFSKMNIGYLILGYILYLMPLLIMGLLIAVVSKSANFASGLGSIIITIIFIFMIVQQNPNFINSTTALGKFISFASYFIPLTYGQRIIEANYFLTFQTNIVFWYDYCIPIIFTVILILITIKIFDWEK